MRFKGYLTDSLPILAFFIVLMAFINSVILLGHIVTLSTVDIIYMNLVAILLLAIFLAAKYILSKRYYDTLADILENYKEDINVNLPEPRTHEQSLYSALLQKVYEEQNSKIEQLYNEKRENLEFITTWVHEVKTPLSASRLIIENSLDKSKEEVLDSIEDELNKIDNYVEQSLYYSRIDSFSKDYLIDEINLEKVVNEAIKRNAKTFINKHIGVEIKNVSMDILTDKKWLHFIINQILSNSLKYTSTGGVIKFYGLKSDKEQQLVVEDNGIGIKPEDLNRIFDKGFTGFNGRKNYSSTGMGLYLSQKLARKLGHNLSVESKYGEFTKIILHFPSLPDYYRTY